MIKLLLAYLRKQRVWLIVLTLFSLIFSLVFYLYRLPLEAVGYGVLLCLFLGTIIFSISFSRFMQRHKALEDLKQRVILNLDHLPQPADSLEKLYQELIKILFKYQKELVSAADQNRADMEDYYTLWAHQIKTPIAAMGLLLQDQQAPDIPQLGLELFKIEQYVEMVLHYLRIDGPASDFVFQSYDLENVVRPVIRKYARMFIQKKVKLIVGNLDLEVLTDAKWFAFVMEQILSNALKYTKDGTITIELEETPDHKHFLVIKDTGLGIAPEDLPRIFEKGFTGYQGRLNQKSTGIGLYLCKLILDKLAHPIQVESVVATGTKVRIGLDRLHLQVE